MDGYEAGPVLIVTFAAPAAAGTCAGATVTVGVAGTSNCAQAERGTAVKTTIEIKLKVARFILVPRTEPKRQPPASFSARSYLQCHRRQLELAARYRGRVMP